MAQIYEFSGAGWYGEVYKTRGGKFAWAVAIDLTERLSCQGCTGFSTAEAAQRSMMAFIKIQQEQDIDRWVAFAGRIPVGQPEK